MLFIESTSRDPGFNIATEEYLLKNREEDFFLLYQNQPSVIIGKHQNAFAEVNFQYIQKKNIPIIRRLSGGGAVFHDLGNLNFCFLTTGKDRNKMVDLPLFLKPIILALKDLGLEVHLGIRNELTTNNHKITGTACHIYKNRAIHHGTLLFSTNLNTLTKILDNNKNAYHSRAIKSIPSPVTNILPLLSHPITMDDFISIVRTSVMKCFNIEMMESLSPKDLSSIKNLITQKYNRWEWNIAYGPKFTVSLGSLRNKEPAYLLVEKGIIQKVFSITWNGTERLVSPLNTIMKGKTYTPDVSHPPLP